jgi:RNA polymerase sigma-70 factor (ECF subfamily)
MPPNAVHRRLLSRLGFSRTGSEDRDELVDALHAHAGLVISSATRITGNAADAEDIAQDIAEKLLRSPPKTVDSWPALLKTMAVNGALDRLRRRRDWSGLPDPDPVTGPEVELSAVERAEALRTAVAALPERDGMLFSLHYFADLSQVAIAERLAMTPNAVGVAIHRLRKRLTADVRQRLGLAQSGDTE